jgi:predicted transcriptional regulator
MSDIVAAPEPSYILQELEKIEQAGIYAIKGYSNSNIGELLGISAYKAKEYIEEYYRIVQQQSDNDPFFLEKIQFNTVKALKELDEISKEAWETVTVASDNGMVTARIQALKLALDVSTKKAQLHNLLGGGQKDGNADVMARTQKIETVNGMLSEVLRDVVSGCPRCAEMARVKLAEAYELMQESLDQTPVDGVIVT